MKPDGFFDKCKRFCFRFANGDAARQIRDKSTITGRTFFYNDHVAHKNYSFNPACLSALFNVPGGTSTLGLPATVQYPVSWHGAVGGGCRADARRANHLFPAAAVTQILSCANTTPVTRKYKTFELGSTPLFKQ